MPPVPGRGRDGRPADAQAAGQLHDDGRGRHGRQDPALLARGQEGAGGGDGAAAHQPPPRLPHLRQGRRVPAAEPGDEHGPHGLPVRRREAHVPEAAGDLHAGTAGPRALRAVPALHPLLRADRRRSVHRPARTRRTTADRRGAGQAVPVVLLRQHHPDLPGRGADQRGLPVPVAPVRPGVRAERLRALRVRQCDAHRHPPRCRAAPAGRQRSRGQRGVDPRQEPLRVPLPDLGRPDHAADGARERRRADRDVVDRRAPGGRRGPARRS